ncbi:Sugar transporter, conserved site,Major facilitator superfamily domain,Major facilitator, sugar [Cinara cedri]|uniref:Sugar transporter, conserved site,Major facilitator superfamily domain,Major facilitator, sugar n=1 Tax=Cinara cedri TaxID=506608 RepID=A0A5E4N2K6_9HEMI|nr:Sugar transporter, conserved site,Major facilitator superfamily domain,Major facilitator, sugar [Cinara cedri]
MTKKTIDIDVLLEEVGEFGRYQKCYIFLLGLALLFTASSTLSFVFTTGDMNYRCLIPKCDSEMETVVYKPPWLNWAVPFHENTPAKCQRYAAKNPHDNDSLVLVLPQCQYNNFNKSSVEDCDEFVFESGGESTIVSAFNIFCKNNKWKLTVVGTLNNIGQFVSLPISGFLSDKYGRKNIIIIGSVLAATFGILRGLSINYAMFLACEFFDAFFSGGVYSATFIMGLGLVGGKHRVFASTILSGFYPIGEATVGLMFWYIRDWRKFLIFINLPGLFFALAYTIIPESVRWLITAGKMDEAIEELKCIAKHNGRKLSDESLKMLDMYKNANEKEMAIDENTLHAASSSRSQAFKRAMSSKRIMFRMLNCSFCWMINTLVYYGLSMSAGSIVGNRYGNFILCSLVEIPALILVLKILNNYGRRESQCCTLLLCSSLCISTVFIPNHAVILNIVLYLVGKFSITVSFVILYMYTAEMFPTEIRHSLLGICSMFGRIGSMVAPQTPLLATYFGESAPLLLFGGAALVSGLLALLFPETYNKRMPDTVLEAEEIGKPNS